MSVVATGGRGAHSASARPLLLNPVAGDVTQPEESEEESDPDRIASIEEKALQRGKINSEQPDLSKHQEQRRVGARAMGAAQVDEGLDHEGPDHESKAGQAHGQHGVEIAVMRVRRLADP